MSKSENEKVTYYERQLEERGNENYRLGASNQAKSDTIEELREKLEERDAHVRNHSQEISKLKKEIESLKEKNNRLFDSKIESLTNLSKKAMSLISYIEDNDKNIDIFQIIDDINFLYIKKIFYQYIFFANKLNRNINIDEELLIQKIEKHQLVIDENEKLNQKDNRYALDFYDKYLDT
jgi:hypothetical protein